LKGVFLSFGFSLGQVIEYILDLTETRWYFFSSVARRKRQDPASPKGARERLPRQKKDIKTALRLWKTYQQEKGEI
jgi:hypothetical protein